MSSLLGDMDAQDTQGQGVIPGTLLKPARVARTQKLLDAARDYPCANCNARDGTIVAAHTNELALGRGFAHKAPHWMVAYLCAECHDNHEGRRGNLSREERRVLWCRAHSVTVSWWFQDGLVTVV
jgi:DNA-directed RNA polymerase subunit RPC12/RpoP